MQIYSTKQAKQTARALEKALAKQGIALAHGKALDAIAGLSGFEHWNAMAASLREGAQLFQLSPMEVRHAEDNEAYRYGAECAIVAHTGFELRYSQDGETPDYVRVCDPNGRECAYWVSDEWQEDPGHVMGAILGTLARGMPEVRTGRDTPRTTVAPTMTPKSAANRGGTPSIANLPFATLSTVIYNGTAYRVLFADEETASCLKDMPAAEGYEENCDVLLLSTADVMDDCGAFGDRLTLSQLRGYAWDDAQRLFINANGDTLVFLAESPVFAEPVLQRSSSEDECIRSEFRVFGTETGRIRSDVPATTAGPQSDKQELFAVHMAGQSRDNVPSWLTAAYSPLRAIEIARKRLGLQEDVKLTAYPADDARHGPFTVFVDGGSYDSVPYFARALEVAELLLETAERQVTIETREGISVLALVVR